MMAESISGTGGEEIMGEQHNWDPGVNAFAEDRVSTLTL